MRDDEFARQAVAGVNPLSIERLKVFPPVSNLDPVVYGPLESALKEEHITPNLYGMTVQQVQPHYPIFYFKSFWCLLIITQTLFIVANFDFGYFF